MIKGRRSNVKLLEFGEAVLFRIPETKNMPGKFEPRWEEGVYVGFHIRSGEDLISTEKGVFRVSTVRRRPANERWSKELIDGVAGSPAMPMPGESGRRMKAYARKFGSEEEARAPTTFAPQPEPEVAVRSWKILKTDIDKHGPSPNCPGCRAITRQAHYKAGHTAECRLRFEKLLTESDEGKKRLDRADDRIAHEILRRQGVDPHSVPAEGGQQGPEKQRSR